MKKILFLTGLIFMAAFAFSQNQLPLYDSSFQDLYKKIALHPPTLNSAGIAQKPVIKKWDKDIAIFVEGGTEDSRRTIINKLNKTFQVITPALNKKIKFYFVEDKPSANYLIKLDTAGSNATWFLHWDVLYNIYKCTITVNTRTFFNRTDQADIISSDFLKSLGDFTFRAMDKPVSSNMSVWRQDITDLDLKILKLQYDDNIKPGMKEQDIDKFFFSHSN